MKVETSTKLTIINLLIVGFISVITILLTIYFWPQNNISKNVKVSINQGETLSVVSKRSSLLAPTGRASKVLSGYSKKQAFTIHKKIYWIKTNSKGNTFVTLQENLNSNCIFMKKWYFWSHKS